MNRADSHATIDWHVPEGQPDALHGDGATTAERFLANATGILAAVALVMYAALNDVGWAWWQSAVAALLTVDLVGGVVAKGLNSAKRLHHAPVIPTPRPAATLVRNETLFTAIHVQPLLIGALFPGGGIWWGVAWYLVALAGVVLISRIPLYLRRPAALAGVAATAVVAAFTTHPVGFEWLPVILVAKLVLGSVREEPYRPEP